MFFTVFVVYAETITVPLKKNMHFETFLVPFFKAPKTLLLGKRTAEKQCSGFS